MYVNFLENKSKMITIKFRQNLKCETFFYFAFKTVQDYEILDEVFSSFCNRFFNCWPSQEFTKNKTLFELIRLYEESPKGLKKKLEKLKKFIKNHNSKNIEVTDEIIQNSKSIFKYYNVLIADELIDFIKKSRNDNFELLNLMENLNKLNNQISDKKILMQESKTVVFCLTKNYLDSYLFSLDWEEVKILNKDVILVLLEQDLYYSHLNVEFYNVFDIYREKFNPYGRRTFLFSQDANRWGEDVLKLQKLGLEKHYKYLFDFFCRKMARNLKVCIWRPNLKCNLLIYFFFKTGRES